MALRLPYERIDWTRQPLGRVSDTEIARKLRTSRQTVQQARKRRGIPARFAHKWAPEARGVRAIVLAAISRRSPTPVRQIHAHVVDDYGSISVRTIYRRLGDLVRQGWIERVRSGKQASDWGYIRRRMTMIDDEDELDDADDLDEDEDDLDEDEDDLDEGDLSDSYEDEES